MISVSVHYMNEMKGSQASFDTRCYVISVFFSISSDSLRNGVSYFHYCCSVVIVVVVSDRIDKNVIEKKFVKQEKPNQTGECVFFY